MTIQEKVAEKISSSADIIHNTIIDKLADIEISKRVDIITKVLSKQEALEKEFKKSHKPDMVKYDVSGALVEEAYSKIKIDSIKKDKEKLSNLIKSLETCLTTNTQESYTKLEENLNKLNNVGGDKKEGSGQSKSEE